MPARSIRRTAFRNPCLRALLSTVHTCQLRRAFSNTSCINFSSMRSTMPFERTDQDTYSDQPLYAPANIPCCIRLITRLLTYRMRFNVEVWSLQASNADDVFA